MFLFQLTAASDGVYFDGMNTESSTPVPDSPSPSPSTSTEQLTVPAEKAMTPTPRFTGCRATLRWTARVLSLPFILTYSIVMIQAVFSGDYPGKSDMITGLSSLFALLVAWRWELAGGGVMLLGSSVTACVTRMQEEPWGFYIDWMLGFLFLASGSLSMAVRAPASAKALKVGRALALVFACLALASLAGCFGSGAYRKFNG